MKFNSHPVQRSIFLILFISGLIFLPIGVRVASAEVAQPAPLKGGPDLPGQAISAGGYHSCGIMSDGTLLCWGKNDDSQTSVPAGTFTQVSAGGYHTCGLKDDGTLLCWGNNTQGQTTVPAGTYTQVSAGAYHTCGLKSDGTLLCWGLDSWDQATVPAGSYAQVSAGNLHTCGLKTDGSLACWGRNDEGQTTVPAGSYTQVSAGGYHTCGLQSDGSLLCWGVDGMFDYGQTTAPTATFSQVSAGWYHTCGLRSSEYPLCWGSDVDGQSTVPAGTFSQVSAGYHHTCGLKDDGELLCWGRNDDGQTTVPFYLYSTDSTPPAVSSSLRADADPTSASSVDFTVIFSEFVTGVDTPDFSLTTGGVSGASITSVVGAGTTYTVTVNTGTGSGTIRLNISSKYTIRDAVNLPLDSTYYLGQFYTIDRIPPTVISSTRADAEPTNAASVDFTVTFSEPVTGVDTPDFSLTTTGGVSGAAVTGVSGAGAAYTVTVNTGTGDGTIRLDVLDNDSILDAAGSPLDGGYTGGEFYTIDKTPPTVVSSQRIDSAPTNATSVNFLVTFSEPVTGVNTADFNLTTTGTVSGASITTVSGSGTSYTVTVNTGTGDGTIRLNVLDDDSIVDSSGNPLDSGYTSGESYTIDRTSPTVLSSLRTEGNPTSASSVTFIVTFSEPVDGVDTTAFSLTTTGDISGADVTSVSGSPWYFSFFYIVTVNTGTGDGTIRLNVLGDDCHIRDAATNCMWSELTSGEFYTIDKTPPTVSSSERTDADPTNATSVNFLVSFSEPITGLDLSDFSLTTTGDISGASIASVVGVSTPFTVTVNTGSGDGTIRLDVLDDDTILDLVNLPLESAFTSGESYTLDRTSPTVLSILRTDPDPTSSGHVDFAVTFSEPVGGVDTKDFSLTTTGKIAGESLLGVSGGPTTYIVAVDTGSDDGTIRLDVVAGASIFDAFFHLDSGYTSGEFYTIDKTPPSVDSILRADPDPTSAASIDFTVTFTEAVTGVALSDFNLANYGGGLSGFVLTGFSGTGDTYTVSADTGIGDGTLELLVLDEGIIMDLVGLPLTDAYASGESYTIDKTPPTVVSSLRADADPTSAASVNFTVTFSEAVTGVDTPDFDLIMAGGVSGAAVTGVTGSGTTYTVSANTGTGDGTITLIVLDDDTILDPASNPLDGGYYSGEYYTIDTTPPTVVSSLRADGDPTSAPSVDFTVTFSKAVAGVDTTDFELTTTGSIIGTSVAGLSGSGTSYTVTVNTGTGDGTIRLDVLDDDSIVDGDSLPLDGGYTDGEFYTIDKTPPETSIDVQPADPSGDDSPSFEFSSPDLSATFECQLDGGGFTTCTSPHDYIGLSDGSHTFEVRAVDLLSNTDPTPASYTWTIDTAPPETSIDVQPDDPSGEDSPSFEFSSPDGSATFECQLDGGGFTTCTSPHDYIGLSDGSHTFEVRAVDLASNTDPTPASYTWTIAADPILFQDDFETGDFSLWTRFNDGNGYLYPCTDAAINGTWGACVDRGTDKRKQLIDETPLDQVAYSVRFNIDMNSLWMADGSRFRFIQVKMGAERPFFIVVKKQGGQYLIQLNTLLDDITKVKTGWYPLSNAPHTLEVEWSSASGAGANDGSASLYLDDALLETLAALDNDTIFVDTFKIGFTSRLDDKPISGIFYLDDIATSNTGYIGPP